MVISRLPKGHRFKVGITNDAERRYHEAFYAYSAQRTDVKDCTDYEGMIIIYVHHCRDIVAMLEHSLIQFSQEHHGHSCNNVKSDFDDHIEDGGDSEACDSPGPRITYLVHGRPR